MSCRSLPGVLKPDEMLEGRARFEAVSGLYSNTRQDDYLWFAFRRPEDWVLLDAPTRSNGGLYIEVDGVRKGLLIAQGAIAVEAPQHAPGHRRLHAMVQHGMTWPGTPSSTEGTVWQGREAVICRWQGRVAGDATFDLATGLVVRTAWPDEVVELTDLHFDTHVDQTIFQPPDRTIIVARWYCLHRSLRRHWRVRLLLGAPLRTRQSPHPVPRTTEAAMEWARKRTDDIRVSDQNARS